MVSFLKKDTKMDGGFSSYHNGGPTSLQDFGRLAQTIGTSILKISQNGKLNILTRVSIDQGSQGMSTNLIQSGNFLNLKKMGQTIIFYLVDFD